VLKDIQKAIFNLFRKEPFYALLLQEINIRMTDSIPTMGVSFDKKINKFFMYINESFYKKMIGTEQEAVLIHEILHILHKHILDVRMIDTKEKTQLNLAMDMAINQYIKGLPNGCDACRDQLSKIEPCKNKKCVGKGINVNDWKTKDGQPFPKFKNFETYFKLIDETKDNSNKDIYKAYAGNEGQTIDQHDFDALSEDEKKEMLKEMKATLERTVEKTVYGHSQIPDFIKDLLKQIEANIGDMNYKKILMSTIKKSLNMLDREYTWHKPNKRYGYLSKGTKVGQIPNAYFLADTSGSISHTEINEFMNVVDNFLKVGQKKCWMGLWHTQLYSVKKYRVGSRLKDKDIEAGGTDPTPALDFIKAKNPDLAVILTDGFFDLPRKPYKNNILWVIAKNGNKDKKFLSQLPGKFVFIP